MRPSRRMWDTATPRSARTRPISRWRWHRAGSSSLQSRATRWVWAPASIRSSPSPNAGLAASRLIEHVALRVVKSGAFRAAPEFPAEWEVADVAPGQSVTELPRVEMRHITGPGHGAHIGDGLDAVLLEQAQEIVEGHVGMADREQARVRRPARRVPGPQAPGIRGGSGVLVASAMACFPVLEVLGIVRGEPGQVGGGLVGQRREVVFHRGGPGIVQGDGHGARVLAVDDPRVADGPAGFPGAHHPGRALRAVGGLEHRARFRVVLGRGGELRIPAVGPQFLAARGEQEQGGLASGRQSHGSAEPGAAHGGRIRSVLRRGRRLGSGVPCSGVLCSGELCTMVQR